MNPQFSIITITFNSGKTIERTLQSVLKQTFKDYEYIIVDGTSKDGTMDIVRKYEPLFEGRMKSKSEPDKGIYDAMNKGIERSSGDIIGIVNSDDWLEPYALENVAKVVNSTPKSLDTIYCGNLIFHYADGSILKRLASQDRLVRYARSYDIGIFHPATYVPKRIYNRLGIFDLQFKLNADTDFILRCYKAGVNFKFVDSVLSNMSDGGATNSGATSKEMADRKKVIAKHARNRLDFYRVWLPYILKVYMKKLLPKSIRRNIQHKLDK